MTAFAIERLPPLSIYIHLPWCIRKCPYCDFNSHAVKVGASLPEAAYVAALLQEFADHLPFAQNRSPISLFFGGGTPSLFSGNAIARIIQGIATQLPFDKDNDAVEITLEANPGTIDQERFQDFRQAGVNRLSLGVQSFQDDKLQSLGRIHNGEAAKKAIGLAKKAGFTNFNIDLMYGLPYQSLNDALHDLDTALSFEPTHLSWYQLTIEPNTLFHHRPPQLPPEDEIWEIQERGQSLLKARGYEQYEVSAYARDGLQCRHNRNYWEFGDYLGIGAGSHSKITDLAHQQIVRFSSVRHPSDYLDAKRRIIQAKKLAKQDVIFEFMLNGLRLTEGFLVNLFTERTGVALHEITPILNKAQSRGLLLFTHEFLSATELGQRFLNDLVEMFLSKQSSKNDQKRECI